LGLEPKATHPTLGLLKPDGFSFFHFRLNCLFVSTKTNHVIDRPPMETVVFTNGCFDLLHPGHIDLLMRAKQLGTRLVVGINSDEAGRKIKGPDRPFTKERERAEILSAISAVDEVIVFDEQTP